MPKRERRLECRMFVCELVKECKFPENCDEHGYITFQRNRTTEEQRKFHEESLRLIGENEHSHSRNK